MKLNINIYKTDGEIITKSIVVNTTQELFTSITNIIGHKAIVFIDGFRVAQIKSVIETLPKQIDIVCLDIEDLIRKYMMINDLNRVLEIRKQNTS